MSPQRPLQHNPFIDVRELERLHSQAYSWALTCTRGHGAEAEDVLQVTYLALIEGRALFRGDSSLRTWLFSVIRNTARSGWRQARYRIERMARLALFTRIDEETALAPPDRVQADVEGAALLAAWQSLPPRQREVLDLVFYRDLSITEAAQVLGVTVGTARVHYERGKSALRRQLAMVGEKA